MAAKKKARKPVSPPPLVVPPKYKVKKLKGVKPKFVSGRPPRTY